MNLAAIAEALGQDLDLMGSPLVVPLQNRAYRGDANQLLNGTGPRRPELLVVLSSCYTSGGTRPPYRGQPHHTTG